MQNPPNPQNPYSNPSGFNNPSVGPGLSPRGPEISFDAIGQAWKLLQPNLGTWIGALLVYAVITLLFSSVQNRIAPPAINANGGVSFPPLYWLISLFSFVIGQFLVGGLMRMAINNVRTGRADFGQMFSAGDVLANLIGAGILTLIAIVIGFILCIVPGFLLSGLFMFVTPLIVDKRLGALEAINTSLNALKSQMWMALLFIVVVGLLAGAGALACGVGVLVTAPLALLTIAVTYNNFVSGGETSSQVSGPPSAPIADPFK